jgi:ABC-2 type transport system permease protein
MPSFGPVFSQYSCIAKILLTFVAMLTLFRKEVAAFFNSLIAYLVMAVFLTGVGLFFWLFEFNALETGYADMNALFDFGPYFFLLLVPAITMRSFSEEMKSGTLEILLTKPITEWQIILGKYFAAVFLVLFALFPTLVYFATVYWLGDPVGNIDTGATMGSYLGLFFLGAIFAAIGIFASSLSDNQIVAFILGVFMCFVLFIAFDFLAGVKVLNTVNAAIIKIGIMEHYRSISRGVIDTRDAVYFLSVSAIFLILTKLSLNSQRR